MWKFGILGMIAYKIKVQRNYRKFILNIHNVIIISFIQQEYNQENKEKFKVKNPTSLKDLIGNMKRKDG